MKKYTLPIDMQKLRLDDGQIEVIDDIVAEILKKKTSSERLMLGFEMWHSASMMLFNYVKSLHPEWNEEKIQKEVARRLSHGAV